MALWSTKRKFLYGGIFIIVVLLVLSVLVYGIFYKTPTCSDGKKNGNETGVDCGGSCKLLCTSDALRPVVLWSKIFNVSGDVYTAVAYVENPNTMSRNPKASYQFRVYDSSNKLITLKDGETSIPKNKKFAVFEVGVILKGAKPKSADFLFTSFSSWERDTSKESEISIDHSEVVATSTSPRVEGAVTNNGIAAIPSLELDVFVMDENQNAIAASRTFVDNLRSRSTQDFVFTWPVPFSTPANFVTVIYRPI